MRPRQRPPVNKLDGSQANPLEAPVSTPDARLAAYAEVGANYRAVDDLRLRLLALLPLATGTGIFLLVNSDSREALSLPAGLFGVLATISLFFYELHGVEKCAHFIHRAQQLERDFQVRGAFTGRPHRIAGVVSEILPAAIIYPASLAGWAFVAAYPLDDKIFWIPANYLIAAATFQLAVITASVFLVVRQGARRSEWEAEDRLYERGIWPTSAPPGADRDRTTLPR